MEAGRAQRELEADRLPLQRCQRLALAPRHALAHRVAICQGTFNLAVARVLPALRVQRGDRHLAPARGGIDRQLLTGADPCGGAEISHMLAQSIAAANGYLSRRENHQPKR